MKNGCSTLLVAFLLLIFAVAWFPKSEKKDPARLSSAADCAGVMGSLKRAFPGEGYNNPKPGIFYMPVAVWTSASDEDRKVVAKLLALQKGCETSSDPLHAVVEIRSISDNRLLAKGPVWNLKEQ